MIKLIFLNDQPNNLSQHYSVDILNFSVVFQAFSSSKNNQKNYQYPEINRNKEEEKTEEAEEDQLGFFIMIPNENIFDFFQHANNQ